MSTRAGCASSTSMPTGWRPRRGACGGALRRAPGRRRQRRRMGRSARRLAPGRSARDRHRARGGDGSHAALAGRGPRTRAAAAALVAHDPGHRDRLHRSLHRHRRAGWCAGPRGRLERRQRQAHELLPRITALMAAEARLAAECRRDCGRPRSGLVHRPAGRAERRQGDRLLAGGPDRRHSEPGGMAGAGARAAVALARAGAREAYLLERGAAAADRGPRAAGGPAPVSLGRRPS